MMRPFSRTTPQQAPRPRAAWQASGSDAVTAWMMPHCAMLEAAHTSKASTSRDTSELPMLENRLLRSQGMKPSILTGAGRAAMGTKVLLMVQRSLIAARLLNQFIRPDVASEVLR